MHCALARVCDTPLRVAVALLTTVCDRVFRFLQRCPRAAAWMLRQAAEQSAPEALAACAHHLPPGTGTFRFNRCTMCAYAL